MRVNLLPLLLLLPLALTAPTKVLPDSAYAYHDRQLLEVRQGAAAPTTAPAAAPTAAPPNGPTQAATPPSPPPPATSGSSSSSTQLVTTIVQAIWPDVDPLIQEGVIYFASGIPSMLSSLMSSWGL